MNFPAYFTARLVIKDIIDHTPFSGFDGFFEVSEALIHLTYDNNAELFGLATDEELERRCIGLLKKAAFEFADWKWHLNKTVEAYRYHFVEEGDHAPAQGVALGMEEEPAYTAEGGLKVWMIEELKFEM